MNRLAVLCCLIACGKQASDPKPPPVEATAAFIDVTVVPMHSEKYVPHQTVLVNRDTIVAIGPTAEVVVPSGAQRIDGKGRWLVPGLIDAHVHFNEARDAILYVANGVTTVRNMWGNPSTVEWRERARTNDPGWIGPSIYTAGPIVDGDPPRWPGSSVVKTPSEAQAEVAAQRAAGYDFIKVYDGLTPEVYDALRAAGAASGMRLAGHAPAAVPLATVFAGQASIEHLTGYMLAAQDATSKAATLTGAERRDEMFAHLDAAKLPALARTTAESKIANCPTLVVMERVANLDHPETLMQRPENKYVTPMTLASWDPKNDFRFKDTSAKTFEAMRATNGFRKQLVRALQDAGATLLAGTDTPNPFVVPGFAMHEELALLVAAGLTPYQALYAATVAPAAWLGAPAGKVAVGARADLVLLDRDPLQDITATTKRAGVMLRGRWFAQDDLDRRLEALVGQDDPFAGVAPPAVDAADGETVFTASYAQTLGGKPVGKERIVVARPKTGGRVIVAQSAVEALTTVRVEVDADGKLTSITHDTAGKRSVATLAPGGKLVIDGKTQAVSPDLLLDTDLVATMIPFADRAKPGTRTVVSGRSFPIAAPVTYTFDRTRPGNTWTFVVTSRFGDATGTYEVNDQGLPVMVTLKAGFGEIVVKQE